MITPFEPEPSNYLAEERARRFVYPVWTKLTQRLKGIRKAVAYYLGYDLSKWQLTADPVIAEGQGMLYAFIRALYGLSVDTKFPLHWGTHKDVIPRGAYLYYLDNLDPHAQAQKLYETCLQNGGVGEMPPVVDIEGINNPTLTAFKIRQCVERVAELFGDVIIYTGFYVWRDSVTGDKAWASAYKLWIAGYPFSDWKPEYFEMVKNYPPLIPAPWVKYHIWQFTSKLPANQYGVSGTYLDGNYASQEFYDAYLADTTPPPDPDPIGEPHMQFINTGGDISNIRSAPVISATNIIGKLPDGAKFTALEIDFTAGYAWAKYAVDPAWLLPGKTGATGWSALILTSGNPLIDFYAAVPCPEGEPMTPEQLARLEAVEAKTAEHEIEITTLQNTPPGEVFIATHKLVTTKTGGEKLRAYPNGSEAVQIYNGAILMELKQERGGQVLMGYEKEGVIITGFLDPLLLVQL